MIFLARSSLSDVIWTMGDASFVPVAAGAGST
jgi:hypothetical protein